MNDVSSAAVGPANAMVMQMQEPNSTDPLPLSKRLACKFVDRDTALNLKGKKRDEAALEFCCGAAALASEEGNEALVKRHEVVALFVSVRGFECLCELANE